MKKKENLKLKEILLITWIKIKNNKTGYKNNQIILPKQQLKMKTLKMNNKWKLPSDN